MRRDLLIAVTLGCLAAAAYGASARAFVTSGGSPQFYQEQFAPAVLYACGRGFVNLETGRSSALDEFLQKRRPAFACSELPAAPVSDPFIGFQLDHRYLLFAAGLTWKALGVSWPALMWFAGVLGGISVLFGYLLCRVGMGRVLSTFLTCVWAMSPLQLVSMPNLRDYAKAPFFLMMLCVVACLARYRMGAGRTWALMAASSAFLGVGFGMRSDVLLYMVPPVVTLLLFRPGPIRQDVTTRIVGAVIAAASFGLVARPVLQTYGTSNNFAHVALLGLTDESNDWLRLNRAPYSFGYLYDDGYVATVVSAYAGRSRSVAPPLLVGTEMYGRVSGEYYRRLLRTFPADMLTRCWAAVIEVFRLPFRADISGAPEWLTPRLGRAYRLRAALLDPLGGFLAVAAAVAFAAVLSTRNARLASLLTLLIIGEAGLGALQFQARHVFHLEIVPLWIYGCLAAGLWGLVSGRKPAPEPAVDVRRRISWAAGAVFTLGLLAAIAVPLWVARRYQAVQVRTMLSEYEAAETEPLRATEVEEPASASVLLQLPLDGGAPGPVQPVRADMLVLDVGGDRCEYDMADLKFRYTTSAPFVELTRSTEVPVPGRREQPVRVLFPVYSLAADAKGAKGFTFDGLEIPTEQRPCLAAVGRWHRPDAFPFLLETVMYSDWPAMRPYETLRQFEAADRRLQWDTRTYAVPESLHPTRRMVAQLVPIDVAPAYRAPIVSRLDRDGLEVGGTVDRTGAYLALWPERVHQRGSAFYVEGDVQAGGLTIGLQRDDRWVVQLNVYHQGRFRATIQVDRDGAVAPVIASYLPDASRRNTFSITKYGWIGPAAP